MESISAIIAIKRIRESGLKLITPEEIQNLFGTKKLNTVYKMLGRIERYGLVRRVQAGKYVLTQTDVSDFEIANLLNPASYVSFESALSFYGILAQFPYEITSATLGKSTSVQAMDKTFSYSHLAQKLYWGYEKKDGALLANPEKAVVDTLYLASKGVRRASPDEWDFSGLDAKKLQIYIKAVSFAPFRKLVATVHIP